MQTTSASAKPVPPLVRLRRRFPVSYDMLTGLIYLLIVQVWGWGAQPLGRDFALLSGLFSDVPVAIRPFLHWETSVFGAQVLGYHLVNALLLLACMICAYWIIRFAIQGPYWISALGATLFMAHPLHAESTLNLMGAVDLLPALAGLAATALYLAHGRYPRPWLLPLALAALGAAVALFQNNAGLPFALLCAEVLLLRDARRWSRILGAALIGVGGIALHWPSVTGAGRSLAQTFEPLYFTLYPLGFLPETVVRSMEYPALAWFGVLGGIALFAFIWRKTRRPELLFAAFAMLMCRAIPHSGSIDPVHLIGGGQLLLPLAFCAVGVAALAHEISKYPKWRATAIYGTTLLCVALFAMHIREARIWTRAGEAARQFCATARQDAAQGFITVTPNYQYYAGAPLCLSEGLQYATPFGAPVEYAALLKVNRPNNADFQVHIESWTESGALLRFEGATPVETLPTSHTPAMFREGVPYFYRQNFSVRVSLTDEPDRAFSLRIEGPMPPKPVALAIPRL